MIKGLPEEELFAAGHRACAGCGEALALRHIMKSAGKNSIVVSATGCMEVVSSPYPETAWEVPWVHGAFENAAAIASGIDTGLKEKGKRNGINLVVLGGDGASFDIGLQALSGAIERGHKFTYVCTDNEAYSNTGIQRSGGTFPYANTTTAPAGKKIHGKQEPKKPLMFIIAAHGLEYAASTSISHLNDFYRKMKKSFEAKHVSFIHALCPCIPGWKIKQDSAVSLSRLAVETGIHPLFEIEKGVLKITHKIEERKPVEEYLKQQGRFKHLTPEEVEKIQKYVDTRNDFIESMDGRKAFDSLW